MTLTLDIKNNKYQEFLNYIKTLDYVEVKETFDDGTVPKWAQEIVLKRKKDNKGFIDEKTFFDQLESELNEIL